MTPRFRSLMRHSVFLPGALLVLACAPPAPPTEAGLRERAAPVSSICGGYEDILALPDRPLTPCEVQTQAGPTRPFRNQWPSPYDGPCQYVDVQVVVDSLGRLEPGSPTVLRTNVPNVANIVVDEMSKAQYRPGRRNGAPVRQVRRFHFASPNAIGRCDR